MGSGVGLCEVFKGGRGGKGGLCEFMGRGTGVVRSWCLRLQWRAGFRCGISGSMLGLFLGGHLHFNLRHASRIHILVPGRVLPRYIWLLHTYERIHFECAGRIDACFAIRTRTSFRYPFA